MNSKNLLSRNVLIVSHSNSETMTRCILNHKNNIENAINRSLRIVLLEELLMEYDIFDTVGEMGTAIKWLHSCDQMRNIINDQYYLLNRVLYIPTQLFQFFKKQDQEYAQREFEAYLGFALNAFIGIGNRLPNGSCAESYSLPAQWGKIKSQGQNLDLQTPNYYWGLSRYFQASYFKRPDLLIYSKIHCLLNWSIKNFEQYYSQHAPIFCFQQPQGEVVFIFSIGSQQLITSDVVLPDDWIDKIKNAASSVHKLFGYFISEILFFIDEGSLTFGCINPEIIRSPKNKLFDAFVCDYLMSEFSRCLY